MSIFKIYTKLGERERERRERESSPCGGWFPMNTGMEDYEMR